MRKDKCTGMETGVTPKTLLFTLAESIAAVRKILIEEYKMSEVQANIAILIAVDVEKQFNKTMI